MNSLNAFYQFYPQLVTAVGVKYKGKVNYMAAAWFSGISHDPPLIGVSISPKRFTHDQILNAGEFNCNFLDFDEVHVVHGTGKTSGKNVDKVDLFEIPLKEGVKIETPYISQAYTVLECGVEDYKTFGDHTWIVGRVLHAVMKEEAFDRQGFLNIDRIKPMLYLGKNRYITVNPESFKMMPAELTI